jgi:hypothetical protein
MKTQINGDKLFVVDHHPAIPPSDLLKKWEDKWFDEEEHPDVLLIQAFQAGADQELEACCAFAESQPWGLVNGPHVADMIRAARRPKSLSLKEQALSELYISFDRGYLKKEAADTIRRALEQLDD